MTTTENIYLDRADRRSHIMDAVREVIDADTDRARRNHEAAANVAITDHLPHISDFLEDYGTDPTNGIVAGPCTDPTHALAYVHTAAGLDFEIVRSTYPEAARIGASDCWLLHPMTGEPVYRIDYQAKWEAAARHIHDHDCMVDMSDFDEPAPPADDPTVALVDALRAFIQAHQDRTDGLF